MLGLLFLFYIIGFMSSWVIYIGDCVDKNKEPGAEGLVYSFIWPLIILYWFVLVMLDITGIRKLR
jgi:hypothetical protein